MKSLEEFAIWCDTRNIKAFVLDNSTETYVGDLKAHYATIQYDIPIVSLSNLLKWCVDTCWDQIEIREYYWRDQWSILFQNSTSKDATTVICYSQDNFLKRLKDRVKFVEEFR